MQSARRAYLLGMTQPLPSLFVSHGAPTLPFEDASPARAFLAGLGGQIPKPRAILAVSAHWETARPTLSGAERPATVHDFYGFPRELYALRYPAPGAPALAERAAGLLREAGLPAGLDPGQGLDHGAWVPLLLAFPEADIPVAQLSVQPAGGAAAHLALGRALAPLRDEGVLILGSGGAVHNLGRIRYGGGPLPVSAPAWAQAFEDWLVGAVEAGDAAALAAWLDEAPEARIAQPSDEHFLPLLVALGAGGGAPGRVLHRGFEHGSLSMAAFGWG